MWRRRLEELECTTLLDKRCYKHGKPDGRRFLLRCLARSSLVSNGRFPHHKIFLPQELQESSPRTASYQHWNHWKTILHGQKKRKWNLQKPGVYQHWQRCSPFYQSNRNHSPDSDFSGVLRLFGTSQGQLQYQNSKTGNYLHFQCQTPQHEGIQHPCQKFKNSPA